MQGTPSLKDRLMSEHYGKHFECLKKDILESIFARIADSMYNTVNIRFAKNGDTITLNLSMDIPENIVDKLQKMQNEALVRDESYFDETEELTRVVREKIELTDTDPDQPDDQPDLFEGIVLEDLVVQDEPSVQRELFAQDGPLDEFLAHCDDEFFEFADDERSEDAPNMAAEPSPVAVPNEDDTNAKSAPTKATRKKTGKPARKDVPLDDRLLDFLNSKL